MSESINMLECRFNLFPARFAWRGQVFEVEAVNECKTIAHPAGAIYHFWVRCEGQFLHLIHHLHSDCWALQSD